MKLEALLANAGIESITSDLFKDPQIMQTLTNTYVKTINEVVSKTANLKSSLSSSSSSSSFNKILSNSTSTTTNTNNNTNNNTTENKKNNKKSESIINDVVGSTFEEFILAAAAVAAATASSSGGSCLAGSGVDHDLELDDEDALNSLEENFGIKPSSRRQLVKCLENFHFNHDDEIDDLDQNDSDEDDVEDEEDNEEECDEEDDDEDEIEDKEQEQKIALLLNTNSLLQQITANGNNNTCINKNDKLLIKNDNKKLYSSHKYINENKIHDCIDNLTSPESLLTKLIEFKSNITSHDLEKIKYYYILMSSFCLFNFIIFIVVIKNHLHRKQKF